MKLSRERWGGFAKYFFRLSLPFIMALSPVKASASHPKPSELSSSNRANTLEDFWNSPFGKEIDGLFPSTNPVFTGLVADLLGISRTTPAGNQLKDFSSIIFEWAEQHSELGSPEILSALGGLGIIKTETGFSVIYNQAGKLIIIDYSHADAQTVYSILVERLKDSRNSFLNNLTSKLFNINQASAVDWIDTLASCYDNMPVDPETGKRIDCCYDTKNNLCEINKSTPTPFPTQKPN